jgi:hypothetical protein
LVHQEVHEQLEKLQAKYKEKHDMHRFDHQFEVGDQFWLYISKERFQEAGKNLKPIHYGPFKVLDKIGSNAFQLELPPYMKIYLVVNLKKLRLYVPPMIEDQGENVQIPSIECFSPEYMNELEEETILDKRVCTSRRGDVEYL